MHLVDWILTAALLYATLLTQSSQHRITGNCRAQSAPAKKAGLPPPSVSSPLPFFAECLTSLPAQAANGAGHLSLAMRVFSQP